MPVPDTVATCKFDDIQATLLADTEWPVPSSGAAESWTMPPGTPLTSEGMSVMTVTWGSGA
jgi:hypothetical protein